MTAPRRVAENPRRAGCRAGRLAVTVPISTWPKPRAAAAGQILPFLSKPAARPTAFGNLRPKASTGRFWATGRRVRASRARQSGGSRPGRPAPARPPHARARPPGEKRQADPFFVKDSHKSAGLEGRIKTQAPRPGNIARNSLIINKSQRHFLCLFFQLPLARCASIFRTHAETAFYSRMVRGAPWRRS